MMTTAIHHPEDKNLIAVLERRYAMQNPVTPLTPAQTTVAETKVAQAAKKRVRKAKKNANSSGS